MIFKGHSQPNSFYDSSVSTVLSVSESSYKQKVQLFNTKKYMKRMVVLPACF